MILGISFLKRRPKQCQIQDLRQVMPPNVILSREIDGKISKEVESNVCG